MIEAPLSSHLLVPLTPATRESLRAKGISEETIRGLTEEGGLALLTLADLNLEDAPECFSDHGAHLYCDSCVFSTQCSQASTYIPPAPAKKIIPPAPAKKIVSSQETTSARRQSWSPTGD